VTGDTVCGVTGGDRCRWQNWCVFTVCCVMELLLRVV
jgi:hypothetical protein